MASETLSLEQFQSWALAKARAVEGASLQPLIKTCKALLAADIKSNFDEGHGPDGEAWPPTVFRVRGPGKTMWDRGILAASASSAGAPGNINEDTPTGFVWGSAVDYGGIHQTGGVIVPKNGRALSIPLTVEAMRSGGARKFPRPLAMVWPKGARSGWLEERKKGRGKALGKAIRQFLLVAKVTIPKRRFLGIGARLEAKIEQAVGDYAAGLLT